MNKTKYIVIASEGEELIFTFPESIAHVHMFEAVRSVKQGVPQNWNRPHGNAKIVSAGFVYPSGECHGHSETLGVKSRGQVDTKLLDIGRTAEAPPSDHIVDVNKIVWPESLTPELADALGVMNFNTGPLAHLFRAAGHDIPERCEPEQAFVLHWMAGLVLKHGAEWRQHVRAKIEELRATIAKGTEP